MPAGISRPDVWTGLALNRDPNDANVPPVWTAVESSRTQLEVVSEQVRGRDYELAQAMSSSPTLGIRDPNEDLNPDNPSSPYAGDVECYREVCMLGQWPTAASGGNNNLLNAGTWRGSRVDAYDPTFESYATGANAPNWISRRSLLAAPTITTASAFEGTKSLTFDVGIGGSGQGIRYGVPVIPGRQYTSSAYVRQGAANTMAIMVEGITAVYDPFRRTVAPGGLGNPSASWGGATYVPTGGAGADYSVSPGKAVITAATVGQARIGAIGSFFDSEQTVTVTAPALAAGASYVEGLVSRFVDISNYYRAFVQFNTDASLSLVIERRLAGVTSGLASVALPLTYTPGDRFVLHLSTQGGALLAWCWPVARAESRIYAAGPVTDTSAALQMAGAIGPISYTNTSSTNANLPCTFSAYSATGSVIGTNTSAVGAYNRLSVTYTADQVGRPAGIDAISYGSDNARGLCIKIITVGTTVNATVNVDALQHEQGAAASTFSASGPVIYPILRHNVERFTRGWRARGFEGVAAAPSVDALAQLSKIFISNEADEAILNAQPDYFWKLGDGSATLVFPDSSGNSGPSLTPLVSKYGAGTALGPGTAMNLPGDPDGNGVTFTPTDTLSNTAAGTILGTGRAGGAQNASQNTGPSVTLPTVGGIPFSATIACWVRLAARTPFDADPIRAGSRQRSFILRCGTTSVQGFFVVPKTAPPGFAEIPGQIWDGKLHFVALSVTQDATNTTLTLWVDQASNTATFATSLLGGIATSVMDSFAVGGSMSDYSGAYQSPIDGSVTKAAAWNRALSNAEVQAIYQGGSMAQMNAAGEFTGVRMLRHVQLGGYNGPTRIAGGSSLLGRPTYSPSIDLYTDTLNSAAADGGVAWVEPDGVTAFEGRAERWNRQAIRYTFGENVPGGEIPSRDQPLLDRDPSYVFPVVTWKRSDGATYVGGLPIDITAAARRYFPRQFDGASDFLLDSQAQDAADYVFYTHRTPMTRCEALVLDPWATPSLWPVCLSLSPGQRVTLLRRAKAANGGAGLTLSYDFFVEKITIPEIKFRQGEETWTYEVQLSPIGITGAPTPMQPWILGDSAWGVLDSTTVLGW